MVEHANITHLYATMRFQGSGFWANETIQYGLRMGVFFGDQRPALGAGDVELDQHSIFAEEDIGSAHGCDVEYGYREASGSLAYSQAFQDAVAGVILSTVALLKMYMHPTYKAQDLRLYPVLATGKVPVGVYPTVYTPTGTTYDGTAANELLPPSLALCISWSSALRARRGRGRIYTGGYSTTNLADGRPNSSMITALRDRWAGAIASLRAIGTAAGEPTAVPIVWHKGGSTGAVINRVRINDEFDTQRSRERQQPITWSEIPITDVP